MDGNVTLEVILWDTIAALVSAIDSRNHTTGHSTRVADYAVRISQALGWSEPSLEEIRLGALLHDIGQISWPETLLQKHETPLSFDEQKLIESHTYNGIDFIENWPQLSFARPYILYHQEWVDGSGYPYGICGDAIPLAVQVVSLADVYEALCYPRHYKRRSGYVAEETVTIMSRMRGKRWDADLFDRFVETARTW
jgi:HD-GYP domain-containing protein (c-di-GMP phosphodiesterase class II)